mmetsp:Transcript_977/g.2693  ORF Transcript_977/g.2693 Transcript_977/m.2693 type:complete len:123 (-) Transcript_977:138-506(-)
MRLPALLLVMALRGASGFAARGLGQKVIGVDLGTRKTGVACGGGFVAPRELCILKQDLRGFDDFKSQDALIERLLKCAIAEGATDFVVGKPLNKEGGMDDITRLAVQVAGRLRAAAVTQPQV